MPKENQQQDYSRLDAKDNIDYCLQMLEFMTDAVYVWNGDALDFNDNHRAGYSHIMDNIRKDIAKNVEILKEC